MFQIKLLIVLLFWILTFIILASCTCVKQSSYISDIEYGGTDAIIKGKVVYTKLMDNKTHSFTVFTILENYTPTVKEKVLKVISPIDEEEDYLIEDILQRAFQNLQIERQKPAFDIDFYACVNKWSKPKLKD